MKLLLAEKLGPDADVQCSNLIPTEVTKNKNKTAQKMLDERAKAIKDEEKEFQTKRKKLLKERGGKGIYFGENLEVSYQLSQVLNTFILEISSLFFSFPNFSLLSLFFRNSKFRTS